MLQAGGRAGGRAGSSLTRCMVRPGAACLAQVAGDNLTKIATRFEFSREHYEPLVTTCMTTLSSKV